MPLLPVTGAPRSRRVKFLQKLHDAGGFDGYFRTSSDRHAYRLGRRHLREVCARGSFFTTSG